VNRGPLTGARAGPGFWALTGAIVGVLIAGGLLIRVFPSDSRVIAAMVTVLPAYGAFVGYLLHRFAAQDGHLRSIRNRVLAGCVIGFGLAAFANGLGLLARSTVPFGVVVGGGAAFALAYRDGWHP